MPTAQFYAVSAANSGAGTWTNIANIPGSDASEGTNTSTTAINGGIYLKLGFNISSIPAGSTITGVTMTVKARANATNSRNFLSVEMADVPGTTYTQNASNPTFTTTAAEYSMAMDSPGSMTPYLGSTNLLFEIAFMSKIASSRVIYVQFAYLTVTYEAGSTNKGGLFFGENF